MLRTIAILCVLYLAVVALIYFRQRSMLYFPTHFSGNSELTPWSEGGRLIGYCREVARPRTVWLMMHGNAGQAANRDYVLSCMAEDDSLYVLEYPGYGQREGVPSLQSLNQAASEAYEILRSRYSNTPVCVVSESIGSGPACALAREKRPPDKIVLIVPFDSLVNVASGHFRFIPVRWIVRDAWDNVEALRQYTGPVDIYGAIDDAIVPIKHAEALAKQIPGARLVRIEGGHNDWSERGQVKIRR